MTEGPRLIIEWESRRQGFVQSLRPAFSRSKRRLLLEADRDPRPVFPVALSYLLHFGIVLVLISAPVRDAMRAPEFVSPVEVHPDHYDIVYVPEHSLPQMKDAGGAAAGSTGASGGAALQTPEQSIRIVRGNPVVPNVVDAPKLVLPHTEAPANLLVASAPVPSVPVDAIQHERIMTVQAFAATAAVAPVPQIVRDSTVTTPLLPMPEVAPPLAKADDDSVAGSTLRLPKPVAKPTPSNVDPATLAAIRAGVPPPDVKSVDIGSIASPTRNTAVVLSSEPGASVGKPSAQSPGAVAMSPTGAAKPGIGEGTGGGAARGTSSGAGTKGGGTGTTTAGAGLGGDVSVHAGISPGAGPGGSGAGMIAGAIPGVTISGGKVMIPSFGATTPAKAGTSRFPKDERNVRPVTVVATASAGGAVSARGILKGAKVYTIYIDTTAGLAFLQFAERGADPRLQHDITVPEPIVSKVPDALRSARVLLAGVMDRNGTLRNLRIVEAASKDTAQNLIEAVERWHFRPALRDDSPVEVDAIFGLNVDTR